MGWTWTLEDSLGEEFKHFCMELEYLFRAKPQWGLTARGTLFRDGDIVANGRAAEEAAAHRVMLRQPRHGEKRACGCGAHRASLAGTASGASAAPMPTADTRFAEAPAPLTRRSDSQHAAK